MSLYARQRYKYENTCVDALEHYDRIEHAGPQPGYVDDSGRVSGLVICEACNHELYDHPPHPFESCLTITCDGKVVKL